MSFTIYHSGGDEQIFVDDKGKSDRNEFVFYGFGNGIHPYHKKQMHWICKMLAAGGVCLNIKQVSTVADMGRYPDAGEFKESDFVIRHTLPKSKNGMMYYLIQDLEMGRGWAVLLEVDYGEKTGTASQKIITQGHRDNVRDELLEGKWIRSLGVDYNVKKVKDLSSVK